jgi:hypothetical protein
VPLAELADPANRCRIRGPSGYAGPAFTVRGMMVWGFTAAVLDRILELGGWARPWNPDDIRDLPQRQLDLAVRGVPPAYATAARGGPELPEFQERAASEPPEGDDGPAAEEVLPADEHGTPS